MIYAIGFRRPTVECKPNLERVLLLELGGKERELQKQCSCLFGWQVKLAGEASQRAPGEGSGFKETSGVGRRGAFRALVSTTDQLVLPRDDRTGDGGDEEDGDEKLHLGHGDLGGVPTGWLMSSKGRNPSPLSCEHENPVLDPIQPPIHCLLFRVGNVDFLFHWSLPVYKSPPPTAFSQSSQSFRPSPSHSHSFHLLSPTMRSPTSLLVFVLSVVSFAVSSPLHSVTHSSRLAKSPISSRQFHYPRALVDVCADIDLSLLVDDVLGLNLLGDICLCLSAFPLDLSLDADLQLLVESLGQTEVEALLETSVRLGVLLFASHILTVSSQGREVWHPVYLS